MNIPANLAGPDLHELYSLFSADGQVPEHEFVAADLVPAPYHGLLVHEHHMTVTVEAHHGEMVNVQVLECVQRDNWYARKSLLALRSNGRIVQFGIMRVHLDCCGEAVRQEILAGQIPLGRILIQHDVLRRIEPTAFLRLIPGPAMMKWFGLQHPQPTYGRLAYIYCNRQRAVDLLEIVAPERPAETLEGNHRAR